MTITKALFSAAAAATLFTAAATAADDDKKFDGAYAGVEAGVDWTKLAGDAKRDRNIYWGGFIGYRKQMDNNMVIGVEGTFGDNGYKNEATGANSDYELGANLIVGQAFGSDGSNLIYGKAGYVRARFDRTSAKNDSYNDGGWRFGAGYERAIGTNLSVRLSGDYTTYGKDKKAWRALAGLVARF